MGTESACGFSVSLSGDLAGGGGFLQSAYCGGIPGGIGYAVLITRGMKLSERVERFSAGAAHKNIMLMIWIFVLAGAFAASAKEMGAIDATVNLTLRILPDSLLLPGIFIAACFISLAIGTSVGDDRGTGSGGGRDCAADWVGCRVDGGCCGGGAFFSAITCRLSPTRRLPRPARRSATCGTSSRLTV